MAKLGRRHLQGVGLDTAENDFPIPNIIQSVPGLPRRYRVILTIQTDRYVFRR